MNKEQIIVDFLSRNPTRWYSANQVVTHTHASFTTVRRVLKKLDDEKKVERQLDMTLFDRSASFYRWAVLSEGECT
jgi:response regulator of citrate/malate metabolism